MIKINDCGHSVETDGQWYSLHPGRCFYCEYLQKHPRTPKAVKTPRQMAALAEANKLRRAKMAKTGQTTLGKD